MKATNTTDTGATPRSERAVAERLSRLFAREPELIVAMIEGHSASELRTVLAGAREAAAAFPRYADLQYFAACAALAADELAEAERLAAAATTLNAAYHDATILSAKIARRRGRPEQAVTLLRRAADAGADYADVHLILGDLLRDRNASLAARGAYRRALDMNANLGAARKSLAELSAAGQQDAATT